MVKVRNCGVRRGVVLSSLVWCGVFVAMSCVARFSEVLSCYAS